MKKRWILLLLAMSVLLSLAACSGERYDGLYAVDDESGLTFTVRGSGSRPKQISVKRDEELLFTTKIKIPRNVGKLGGNYGFFVLDLNFDGHSDFMIADGTSGDCTSYLCWLYNAETSTYTQSDSLSGLCNIKADSELKALFAFTHTYTSEKAYLDVPASHTTIDSTTKYVWTDGVLTPQIRASITYYSETGRYCYSVSNYDSETGDFAASDDKWLTPEEYKTYDMGFLYYFNEQ
ncbi:MAG: hypothetical protein IJZ80_00875 [Clostridia bacterium]|nr:hypothetical protein [Clostridia bacterium]